MTKFIIKEATGEDELRFFTSGISLAIKRYVDDVRESGGKQYTDECHTAWPESIEAIREAFRKQIADQRVVCRLMGDRFMHNFIVKTCEAVPRAIACAWAFWGLEDRRVDLSYIYVLPEFRNRGIGKTLTRNIGDYYGENGFKVYIEPHQNNKAAVKCVESAMRKAANK